MEMIRRLKPDKKTIIIIGIIGLILMMAGGGKTNDKSIELSDEIRLKEILSHIENAGDIEVMLSLNENNQSVFAETTKSNKYIGAVILAEGGGKSDVKEKIIKAVNVVTGLDPHRIVVYRLDD